MKNILKILVFTPMLTMVMCDSNTTDDCQDMICTLIFENLTVKVVDSRSEPVILDDYKVVLVEDGTDITPDYDDLFNNPGSYIVFSDSYAGKYENKTTVIRFKGFIDSKEVASSEFTVGADCCHVKMISESSVITID